MTSTFRLTRAEFKKIFKRASIYIMALLLVIAIIVSIYMFNPIERVDNTISYGENLTVDDYYNNFFSTDLPDSKSDIDKSFENTNEVLKYYQLCNDRDINLKKNYDDFVSSYEELKNTTEPTLKEQKYTLFKTSLNAYYTSLISFDNIQTYPHIDYIFNTNSEVSSKLIQKYFANTKTLLTRTETENSTQILDTIETNNFVKILKDDLNAGLDYISPTALIMAQEIKDNYDNFNSAILGGTGSSNLNKIEIARESMLVSVQNFRDYLEIILDYDYPVVLINKDTKTKIFSHLDDVIEKLKTGFDGNPKSITNYINLNTKLIEVDLPNYYTKTFALKENVLTQVRITYTEIEEFGKVKAKVETNKVELINVIKKYHSDETIRNIQNKITDYSLLSQAYNDYLLDSIKLAISKQFSSDEFVKLYNYDLSKFNIYSTRERITANKYYIDNNIYSSSLNTNFSFNQNSGKQTNVFDFMYFAMEICTVLIIIFGMMMVCSLITQETESGTIKLLLTRPYKRSKIVTAKLLATIFFVLCFILFSAIICFAGGYFVFGLDTTNILMIFNSSSAISISPILLMIINLLSLTIDVIFYVIIALMISILFKNYAGSISFCFVILLITFTLNILFPEMFWYSLFPGMNLHLFKYFGNSFVSLAEVSVIQNILITPIQSTMNLLYSFLILIAYLAIALTISYSVFNKRDF